MPINSPKLLLSAKPGLTCSVWHFLRRLSGVVTGSAWQMKRCGASVGVSRKNYRGQRYILLHAGSNILYVYVAHEYIFGADVAEKMVILPEIGFNDITF